MRVQGVCSQRARAGYNIQGGCGFTIRKSTREYCELFLNYGGGSIGHDGKLFCKRTV